MLQATINKQMYNPVIDANDNECWHPFIDNTTDANLSREVYCILGTTIDVIQLNSCTTPD